MSMTGGISFFDKSLSTFADGVSGSTAVASSNSDHANLALGNNIHYSWQSIGSNDTTTETITITLPTAMAISRIFLLDHNFKSFTIQYGSSQDFANVTGLDEYSDNEINVSDFARNTAYFEFDSVTTDTIIITATTTQVADSQKFLTQFIATNELGTLIGYPDLRNVQIDRNIRRQQAISGRSHIQKGYREASFGLNLRSYQKQADIDLLDSLHDRERSFLVWPVGGLPDQFRIKQRGFRVQDLYLMQVARPLRNGYRSNVYIRGVTQRYNFEEVVD